MGRSRSRNPSRRRKGLAERQGVGVAVAPIYFIYKNTLAESKITSKRVKNELNNLSICENLYTKKPHHGIILND